jgi:predicted nucleotidyltransferase component of viral defense system
MLLKELNDIIAEQTKKGVQKQIILNLLEEHIQYYFLNFIYNSKYGKNLIFIGGSALRICYGLNRLSEDIDMDIEPNTVIDKQRLAEDIVKYFKQTYLFDNLEYTISGKDEKIYFKLPILKELNISDNSESDKLYVKLEISDIISKSYKITLTPISKLSFNFIIKNYDLETLMASKINAIFKSKYIKGNDKNYNFKGRDYFDLLWYLQKGVKPNMDFIRDTLNIDNLKELYQKLYDLIENLNLKYLKEDLLPLFEDGVFITNYCENYKEMSKQYLLNI